MPTFNLTSDTAVVLRPYDYEGRDSPKPLKADLEYIGDTTYGEIVALGATADTDYDVGDIVVYTTGAGIETSMNGEIVRIIEMTNILYYLS